MYVGHLGFALLAKYSRRATPLLWLVPCAYAPDVVEVALGLIGFRDRAEDWSHTIPAALVLALGALLATRRFVRDAGWKGGLIAALAVLSHLPADWVTGHKPLWPGGPGFGLGLYDRPRWDFAIELSFVGAVLLLDRVLRGRDGWPVTRLAVLLALLTAIQAAGLIY